MEWLEDVAKIVGIVAALVAAGLGLWQARRAIEQWKRELRWKQAALGKEVVDEMWDHIPTRNALQMSEPRARRYDINGTGYKLAPSQIQEALEAGFETKDDTLIFIQDCYDSLLYYLDRLEHFIETDLVRLEDVRGPVGYYVSHLAAQKELISRYAREIGYEGALRFLERFEGWKVNHGPKNTAV